MDEFTDDIDWLQGILSSIGDAVIATDAAGGVRFMNPLAEALTGCQADDALGKRLETVIRLAGDRGRQKKGPLRGAIRENRSIHLSSQELQTCDGRTLCIDLDTAPIRNEAGDSTGSVLVFRDVSERRYIEKKLGENEARYHTLIDSMDQAYCVIEMLFDDGGRPADYRFLEVNAAFERQTGLKDVQKKRMLEIAPDHERHWFETYGRVALTGEPIRFANEAKSLGRWFDVYAFRLGDPDLRRVALLFTDITSRRTAEQRLVMSEQRHRRLFESSRDGIMIVDAESMRVVDLNPYMRKLLGQTPGDLAGMALWETGLFRNRDETHDIMKQLKQDGYVRYDGLPLITGRGEVQYLEVVCNRYNEQGRGFIQCNVRDISSRKQLEKQIQEQSNALAETGRRKDEFLAMLSHELRNPLAPIFNALRLIEEEGPCSRVQQEANTIIERQVRHLSRLVNDLLQVSRITTGRIQLHTARVNVNDVIEKSVERMRPFIQHRQQTLSVSLAEAPIWLEADETRLEQIIGNLLHNASKYNFAGGHIGLTVENTGEYARISVTDDGQGIAPELLPHVFELFTQSDKSLDRAGGGLGIGLALAKSLVEMHGGSIEAASAGPQRGSAFTVWLPVVAKPDAAAQTGKTPSAGEKEPAAKPLRILVVDDHKDATRMSVMLLRSWGHEVRMAYNGLDALREAAEFNPQVVLLDIGLPDMDGYQVARHLRRDPRLRQARLVAVTGYGRDINFRQSQESDLDAHLVKPVEPARLKQLLGSLQFRAGHA